jgi:hypothetical protein
VKILDVHLICLLQFEWKLLFYVDLLKGLR